MMRMFSFAMFASNSVLVNGSPPNRQCLLLILHPTPHPPDGARELAGTRDQSSGTRGQFQQRGLVTELLGASHHNAWYEPGHHQNLKGSGPWVEVPALMPGTSMVSWAHRYERELPAHKGDHKLGKVTRKWAPRSMQLRKERWQQQMGTGSAQAGLEVGKNRFAPVAMAFMLPIMRDHDKKTHGVDLLGPDFIVLGKLVHTLGVFMECLLLQPEAAVLGVALLDLLRSRYIVGPLHFSERLSLLFYS